MFLTTDASVHTISPSAPHLLLQVLDAIDEGASALIVAPTSSGKTFISSYCINSVVRATDHSDGIVVFVAPTKALVNQVAAQVRRRILGIPRRPG
jgi:superfamily II RNA helicase